IVAPNADGARACERLVGHHFGRSGASCHPANTTNPAFAGGTRARRLADDLDLDIDPASVRSRRAVEVYPHPAIVVFFNLDRILTYKHKPGRDLAHLRGETLRLLGFLENLREHEITLDATAGPGGRESRHTVHTAPTKAALRRVEDSLDAVVCAYIARHWRLQPAGMRVLGTLQNGYILVPVTPQLATRIDTDPTTP